MTVWNGSAAGAQLGALFRRMAEPERTAIDSSEIFKYWEANIAGAPLFPAGVKMFVGSFRDLFGTRDGRRLQAWCRARGWVLSWALGEIEPPNGGGGGGGRPCQPGAGCKDQGSPFLNRTLDPTVFGRTAAAQV